MGHSTIALSDDLRRRLMEQKQREGLRSMEELVERMLREHQEARFLAFSEQFRRRADERGLGVEDLLE